MDVIGWDIGGVNTKVARVAGGDVRAVCGRPYELQRDPGALVPLLRELAGEVGGDAGSAHAVTMTAELSQMFRTKREGVAFVLDAVEAAFPVRPRSCVRGGRPLPHDRRGASGAACRRRRELGGDGARAIAAHHPDALLVDIGTTTTDIIPIVGGCRRRRRAHRSRAPRLRRAGVHRRAPHTGRSDRQPRCRSAGTLAGVSAEGFALAGDVHLWRGDLAPADYTCPTPDGRPATREFAGERLARVVCADRELLDEAAVSSIADALAAAQVARITAAIARVRRASSVAAHGGRHRPGRLSGRGGRARGGDAGRAARGGARRCRRAVRASRLRRAVARAGQCGRGGPPVGARSDPPPP